MNRREWLIAGPVLAAMAACICGYLHGIRIESSYDGIVALRAIDTPAGAKVGVVAGKALHILDANGQRIARQALETLGLHDSPNDLDLTVDPQGQLEAWFFEDADAGPRVIRCQWQEESRRMAQCGTAASGPQLKWDDGSRAVHLAVDRVGERMFVADARGARVQVFSLSGKRMATSSPDTLPLYFPNRLRYLGDNRLVVADNDHHRLVWAEARAGAAPRLVATLDASDHPQARSSRTKVTDVAFGQSGTLWMLAVKQGQKDGDVLVFDANRRPVARAQLPAGADPLVVEALSDTALVADYSLIALYRLDPHGRYLGEFGDAAFRSELAPMRELSGAARLWTTGSLIAGALVIAAGLFLGWRFSAKVQPRIQAQLRVSGAASAATLRHAFPVVLDPTPRYIAAMRKQAWVLGVLMVGGAALAFALMLRAHAFKGSVTMQFVLWLLLALATWLQSAWNMLRAPQLRVTATRAGLFREGKPVAEAPLEQVYASERVLLVGRKSVIYQAPATGRRSRPPLYDLDLLRSALLHRLPESNLLDAAGLQRVMMRQQPLWLKIGIVTAIVLIVGWTARELLPL